MKLSVNLLSALLAVLLSVMTAEAQNYRYSYMFFKKNSLEGQFKANEMKLDCYKGKSAFYSERTFLRDSLYILTFNENGEIIDNDIYNELVRIPGNSTTDLAVIDYLSGQFTLFYQFPMMFLSGKGDLEMPQWEISEETMVSSEGYACRKASARYLGRQWTIWYSEEIPSNAGPWLLWGAPGLIVLAQDSENLVNFRLTGIEEIDNADRIDFLTEYYSKERPRRQYLRYGIAEAERLHTRLMSDIKFFNQTFHITDNYIVDRNGKKDDYQPSYIPLIPDGYWKNK